MSPKELTSTKYDDVQNKFVSEINNRSNKLIEIFLFGYFLFGLFVSFYYDTWLIGITVGSLVLFAYYLAKHTFPDSTVNQYVVSAGIGVFMGQFIYQMHGMFEMHFFAFIGSALLITYQNWKAFIPLAVVIVLHHGIFGYLQYQSFLTNNGDKVYFTQLDYMDLQTFIFHCCLAVVILAISGIWAYDLNRRTKNNTRNVVEIENLGELMSKNIEYATILASGMKSDVVEPVDKNDLLGEALKQIHLRLKATDPVH